MTESPNPSGGLASVIEGHDIVVCVGTGGVGKTTVSASIALKEAIAGKKSLVLTIDPARRLADAIGITGVGSVECRIPVEQLAPGDIPAGGGMWAMMLEAKRTFDQMVEKYAPSPETARRIFDNPVYQHVSGALSGSQEYMAIEKLSELHEEKKYDLIVLDTPPSANALDFFTAPERMMAFLDQSVLQWFLKPYLTLSRMGMKTFKMTSGMFLKVIEKILGGQIIKDMLDFFESFEGMYQGFKQRAETVDRVLRRSRTAFVLVASPSRMNLDDARKLMNNLKSMGMPLAAVVINKATMPPPGTDLSFLERGPEVKAAVLAELGDRYREADELVDCMYENAVAYSELIRNEAVEVDKFRTELGGRIHVIVAPRLDEDIHDMKGLDRLGDLIHSPK